MKKRKKILIFFVSFLFIIFGLFELFFVLPYPWYKGENLKLSPAKKDRYISFDILKNLPDNMFVKDYSKGRWIRKDYYQKGYNITLGKFLWLVETRRGIPAKQKFGFEYTPESSSIISFGIGVDNKKSDFKIKIDNKIVFKKTLSPAPNKKSWLFNKILKVFYFKLFPQKGYWKDYKIPLEKWAGKKIKIEFEGNAGYWANPIITESSDKKFNHPNIILIQIDALRANLVKKGYLPFLDKLKNSGVFFNNAYTNANWTRASNYVQFYGKTNSQLGLSTIDFYLYPMEKLFFYQNRFQSLPLFFEEKGYRTAAIVDNVFIHGFSDWGLDIGFQTVKDFEKMKHEAAYITDETIKWIKRNKGTPFFLFLDYNVTHFPYHPPVKYLRIGELIKNPNFALYKACARYTDDYLKKLITTLDEGGYLKNTMIIINSDHGETFYNAGRKKLDWNLEPVKVHAHGYSLWSEEIRVPILFYWKNRLKKRVAKKKISIKDIPKTIIKLAGFEYPKDFGGNNLAPFLLGDTNKFEEKPIIIEGRNEIGIISGDYKYITGFDNRRIESLYNIKKDPLNRKNILKERPEIVRELRGKIYELYQSYYPILVVNYNVGENSKSFEFDSLKDLKFYGGDNKIEIKDNKITVIGKGSLYFVFTKLPKSLKFEGETVRIGEEQMDFTGKDLKTDIIIDNKTVPLLLNPYNQKIKNVKGFWIYITDVLSFVSSKKLNSEDQAANGMKQLLIDWGYVKQ